MYYNICLIDHTVQILLKTITNQQADGGRDTLNNGHVCYDCSNLSGVSNAFVSLIHFYPNSIHIHSLCHAFLR